MCSQLYQMVYGSERSDFRFWPDIAKCVFFCPPVFRKRPQATVLEISGWKFAGTLTLGGIHHFPKKISPIFFRDIDLKMWGSHAPDPWKNKQKQFWAPDPPARLWQHLMDSTQMHWNIFAHISEQNCQTCSEYVARIFRICLFSVCFLSVSRPVARGVLWGLKNPRNGEKCPHCDLRCFYFAIIERAKMN